MALGVVTLRTIEYIVDASTNTVCGGVSTDFLF